MFFFNLEPSFYLTIFNMKKFYTLLVLLTFTFSAFSQKNYFSDLPESTVKSVPGDRFVVPSKARFTKINSAELRNFLWSLPSVSQLGGSNANAPLMILPLPNGQDAKFRVWESTVMEPGLKAKFSEIRTFTGQGVDDPRATLKMSYDPYFGFYAQVLTPNGIFYIDPAINLNVNFYQSYYRTDYVKNDNYTCYAQDESPFENAVGNTQASGPCRGTSLFKYRIAIACTGEYARAAVGNNNPTVAQTLAKIVISLTRITGVYESELSVTFSLIDNEESIIYTNPTTDPFTNNNPGALIGESQNVITAAIGSGNFDIGHTFSTGGGGLAGLGVVCNDAQKARGITGINRPYGDAYDIDYVSHEIGHQFGAGHTFNSSAGSCGGGNRSSSSAYEPGSGTTIMGYASICDNDDLQNHSDPMFHTKSFDQISIFLSSGGACKVATPTGNTLPVITAMSNNNMNIPILTPFTLSGAATDADGDALTYSWEEWDLGPTTTWSGGANSTTAPLFKARIPKTTGVRTFPDIAVILANYPVNPSATMGGLKGETLPNVARTMKFRFTVRDNRAGGGGVVTGGDGCQVSEIFQIKTVENTGPFEVLVPNGFENYPNGSSQTIKWSVANTNVAPINTQNVKITLSTDGGMTYPIVLAESTPNDGSETLTITGGPTTTARVRVEAIGNIYFDVSNNNFTISGSAAPTYDFTSPSPVNITCNGSATASATLGTTVVSGFSAPIQLTASGAPAGTSVTFSVNPVTPGNSTQVTLNNANTLANGTYTIVVTGVASGITKTRDITFIVSGGNPPAISSQPAAATVCQGTPVTFSVVATGATTYQWQVSTNGGASWTNISGATSASYNTGVTTAAMSGNIYRVIVSNQCTSATSGNAVLTVNSGVNVVTDPVAANACSGQNASFNIVVNGTATYQWQVNTGSGFVNIPGATSSTLNLASVTSGMNGNLYQVIVTSACGGFTSTPVALVVNTTASITSQPAAVTTCEGTATTFTVGASGTGVQIQWQVSTNGGTSFTNISGATSATYSIASTTASQNGNIYRAVVSSQCNTVNSNNAQLTVNSSINVVTAPVAANACTGQDASFSVVISGTGTYQWQVNTGSGFANIPGATSATLNLPGVTASMNGNSYQVIVTNPCRTITTTPVNLIVNTTASITTQPVSVTTCEGPAATFTVAGAGTGVQYQWQVSTNGGTSFTDITGATSTTYSTGATTASLNGNIYRVKVSSQCNTLNSQNATLTVNPIPAITTAPVNTGACNGSDATITAVITGSPTYVWEVSTDGGATYTTVSGATTGTLQLINVTASMDGNKYRVTATNSCGTVTSTPVTLNVNTVVTINTQPEDVTLCAGANASFSVAATGTGLGYQWQVSTDGGATYSNISGATSATYSIANAQTALNNNKYRVLITSACAPDGTLSDAVTLVVNSSVIINTAPVSVSACIDGNATFSVDATGSGLLYQWQLSTDDGATFTNISGANGSSYTFSTVNLSDSGKQVRVIVSGEPCGTITTPAAILTVNPVPSVVINTPAITALYPGLTTTLSATVIPSPAASYQWYVGGNAIPGATSATYTVSSANLGTYTLTATAANGCVGSSTNSVTIRDSADGRMFIYPSPNTGQFNVAYYGHGNAYTGPATVTVFDSKGARVFVATYIIATPYQPMHVDLRKHGKGIYWVELSDKNGKRIKTGSVSVL